MDDVIETRDLRKTYGATVAVDGIDLRITRGSVVAVLGPNGAGKSTTLELLIGLRAPTSGSARLFGARPARVRHRFGAMLQESQAPESLTVAESVDLVAHYYPRRLPLAEVLARADLTTKARQKVGQLSGGQRQRLNYAMAITGDPELLFLDEPTAALDIAARLRFWEQVRDYADRGRTVVLSTHNMAEAQNLAERIILIDRGRIVADGTPTEIAAQVPRTIRLRTDASPGRLARLPQVLEVSVDDDGRLVIHSGAPEEVLREIFAAGVEVAELSVSDTDLEAAFLHLVDHRPASSVKETTR